VSDFAGIEVQNVFFRYSDVDVLANASLRVGRGEVVGLLGINGAGKTTLLRSIVGLLRPPRGRISVAGFELPHERCRVSERLGWVPDESLLYPKLSALENMNRFALLWGVPADAARARSRAWLEAMDLWPHRHSLVEGYSKGMRQRLMIGCALLHDPDVLVMDEPFNALDMKSSLWLRDELRHKAEAGKAVLVSSHQPEALDAVVDRLLLLQHGRIERDLSRAELLAEGGTAGVFRERERSAQSLADER
jgi:ABC-2 type transport system ATP-binding protein